MKHSEKRETPKMESEHHSKGFLKKAARMAPKKRSKKARSSGR